jgi:hypothetical protein
MSDRKETPDILGNVLGGPPAKPARVPDIMPDPKHRKAPARRTRKKAGTAAAPKVKAAAKSTSKKAAAKKSTAPVARTDAWEYLDVMFYDYGGYVVRYIGGKEMSDWKRRNAGMSDYINRLGGKGWELVSLIVPKRHHILAVFKRPKQP